MNTLYPVSTLNGYYICISGIRWLFLMRMRPAILRDGLIQEEGFAFDASRKLFGFCGVGLGDAKAFVEVGDSIQTRCQFFSVLGHN